MNRSGGAAVVIPARIGSTRLPRKPLLDRTGRPLVQHVVDNAARCPLVDRVVVATDSEEIRRALEPFGTEVVMTSDAHRSGSDRVAEAARLLGLDLVVNVQGDEPDLDPGDLANLVEALRARREAVWTLVVPIEDAGSWRDPHVVKAVCDAEGRALYFSRSPLPWGEEFGAVKGVAHKHIGVYGYARETLERYTALPAADLEKSERLEQLRALFHGIEIRTVRARHDSLGVDTEADYQAFIERWTAREARR